MVTLPVLLMTLTSNLPMWQNPAPTGTDWLTRPVHAKSQVYQADGGKSLVIANGLVARTIRVAGFTGTTSLRQLETEEEFIRAVRPELRLTLNGTEEGIGGATGQPNHAFLRPEWVDSMAPAPSAFAYEGFSTQAVAERFGWGRVRPSEGRAWPPAGVELRLKFRDAKRGLVAEVCYEVYDQLPLVSKRFILRNEGETSVRLDRYVLETLAFVEAESNVDETARWTLPNWAILTDYAFGGMGTNDLNQTLTYRPDPEYLTQVNYERTMPALLEVAPKVGPGVTLACGEAFTSFRAFELLHDSRDRERQGLGVRRMMRMLAPWSTESPLMMHLTTVDDAKVREAIDQAAAVGFEMIILSFGSGLNMEDTSPENIAKFKRLADYAKSKGLDFGGYSLLASRSISFEDDAINPKTGKSGGARFGYSPCLGSKWGISYFERIQKFIEETGFTILEHDGSYPGDVCASTQHPGHKGLDDSQWTQFQQITKLYHWCRERGVYLNVPDTYALQGANKIGMGYRETNWSLPRAEQHLHARQNLFDGTWDKAPTMGWMFVPLVEYHGGGPAATIEPLREHLADYRQHLYNNLGYGAQACYRGMRLYDSPETQAAVIEAVQWFKRHRAILEADVIHLRRADGRDWDGILHVDPFAGKGTRAMAVLYNPLVTAITRKVPLPLHFAGLQGTVNVSTEGKRSRRVRVPAGGILRFEVKIPAGGFTWLTFGE